MLLLRAVPICCGRRLRRGCTQRPAPAPAVQPLPSPLTTAPPARNSARPRSCSHPSCGRPAVRPAAPALSDSVGSAGCSSSPCHSSTAARRTSPPASSVGACTAAAAAVVSGTASGRGESSGREESNNSSSVHGVVAAAACTEQQQHARGSSSSSVHGCLLMCQWPNGPKFV